jgi:hypothetical protein
LSKAGSTGDSPEVFERRPVRGGGNVGAKCFGFDCGGTFFDSHWKSSDGFNYSAPLHQEAIGYLASALLKDQSCHQLN